MLFAGQGGTALEAVGRWGLVGLTLWDAVDASARSDYHPALSENRALFPSPKAAKKRARSQARRAFRQ